MMTEEFDIYGLPPGILSDINGLPTLEPLWWGTDEPSMDDLYDKAGGDGGSLQPMIDRLKIYPVNINKKGFTLFLAQYKLDQDGTTNVNFMISFPIDVLEMMVLIGQYSSLPSAVDTVPGERKAIPPLPTELFNWPEKDRIVFNKMYVAVQDSAAGLTTKMFAKSLGGGEEPKKHWWFNVLFSSEQADQKKFPVPGEFLALGVRIFIDKIWGKQKSNPFLYSGNWMDTVFYTSAVITEVIDPTDTVPYSTYKVKWHGNDDEITVKPSDFALYKVGDRVTILKDVTATKKSQRWDDDDMKTFGDTWMIVPVTFYGLEKET